MYIVVSSCKIKIFVKPTCGERDIVVTISVRCMCVHCACVRPSFRICPGYNFYIYAWISKKKFFAVVLFDK